MVTVSAVHEMLLHNLTFFFSFLPLNLMHSEMDDLPSTSHELRQDLPGHAGGINNDIPANNREGIFHTELHCAPVLPAIC